jgi:hypothetical protein
MSAEKGARRDADDVAENVERGLIAQEQLAAAAQRIAGALERLVGEPSGNPPRNNAESVVASLGGILEAYQGVVSGCIVHD